MRRPSLALTFVLLSAVGYAQSTSLSSGATYERQITTAGPGPQRLTVDSALLSAGAPFRVVRRGDVYYAEDGLNDLRLFAADGRPVPYLLIQPPPAEREWIVGRVFPIAPTKKSSGFEVVTFPPRARTLALAAQPGSGQAQAQRRRAWADWRGRGQ